MYSSRSRFSMGWILPLRPRCPKGRAASPGRPGRGGRVRLAAGGVGSVRRGGEGEVVEEGVGQAQSAGGLRGGLDLDGPDIAEIIHLVAFADAAGDLPQAGCDRLPARFLDDDALRGMAF